MKFRHLLFLLVVLGIGVSMASNVRFSKAAFGTSPPWVRNDHMLPGTSYEETITLSRNDPDQDMKVNIRLTGDKELTKWIKIENQNRLVMKAGEKIFPMKVKVEVPKRAALRDYRGGIFITLSPVETESGQGGTVAITLGANILVEISVIGDKIQNYRVQSISTNPMEEGQPLTLDIEMENLGNTEVTSINGQVDIFDENETQILKSLPFGPLSQSLLPDEKAKVQITFDDFKLDPGTYWLVAKAYKGDEKLYENRLNQVVAAKVVPVVTPEDSMAKKPGLPKIPSDNGQVPDETQPSPEIDDLKPTAPVIIQQAAPQNNMFLILGLVGLGFGLIALIGIIFVLVIVLRNQRQANLQQYLANSMRENKPF